MKTRVYAQHVGGSGLDARYLGTVNVSPKVVAEQLRTVEGVSYVETYALIGSLGQRTVSNEVVVFGT